MFESCGKTHAGLVRSHNEDCFLDDPEQGLWVVADGVGGQRFGEFASQLAVTTVKRKIQQGKTLAQAITDANSSILEAANEKPELKGMATTIVAAKFKGNAYEVAWIGDSRAYVSDGKHLSLISRDHNHAQFLADAGEIAEEEVDTHPSRHILTQALGLGEFMDIGRAEGKLAVGDTLLLCSDGLSGEVAHAKIEQRFVAGGSVDSVASVLLDDALAAGGRDNVTLTLTRVTKTVKARKIESNTAHEVGSEVERMPASKAGKSGVTSAILLMVALLVAVALWLFMK